MRSDPEMGPSAASIESKDLPASKPHRGCNCRRGRTTPTVTPLLTDDLVIAARDRAREPELPEATLERALSTPISPRLARYDLIIVSDAAGDDRETRIAAEFARHEHRVFHIGKHDHRRLPTAPTLRRIDAPATRSDSLLDALSTLRRSEAIEAAVLFAPATLEARIASEVRERWGWRIVASSDAPVSLQDGADVLITFDADSRVNRDEMNVVPLPEDLPWPARWAAIDKALRASWPRASVVILTHDNLAFSRMCLASLLENTDYPNYEIIVVDNASSDGTVEDLRRLAGSIPNVKVILNDHNAGFGPGNNQGLASATGEILVLLNNDTVVPHGWLTRLARHLDDPAIGLIGPGTNRSCNEAQIDIPYQTYGEFRAVARAQGVQYERERLSIRMPMMFCVAFRRDTYELLGPLDERYEVGMFEDEDYALRAKAAGLQVAWTPEVYVHHAYHASIGKLLPTGDYMRLVKLNQGRFEEKWGICWERHRALPASAPTP
ncbi:MAG TPA: glycosyltransferase family 2 protein [Thermomicrobiales bacterium]|nr:glycosyltransferase family 2 protein [Thermomicrobiales bacterium]